MTTNSFAAHLGVRERIGRGRRYCWLLGRPAIQGRGEADDEEEEGAAGFFLAFVVVVLV